MIVSFPRTHGGKHFIIFDGLPFMKRDTLVTSESQLGGTKFHRIYVQIEVDIGACYLNLVAR